MKHFYFTLLLLIVCLQAYSQGNDTCIWVAQNNLIGGLDCAAVSVAPYSADSYQWLNCDSLFAPFPGDTTSDYSGPYSSTNVALVVSYLGCIDTSDCYYVCTWGLNELINHDKALVKIIDVEGRETEDKPNTLLFYIYSDGTTKKVFRIE